ncbi:MAG TPA: hybrid sensor histidine kinase/response regulator [Candidatus Cloacimonadota bacterium]|nr:hybrid sensor histidine kinase/response regulator [Candidatus Cloacimonadota bacterium]HQB40115.1 hybrid sensor histidine kinase/response regulator [Candidatus Cloacimonadota bacterium]
MVGQDPEMLQMFLEEANEHLNSLEPDLLLLESNKENPDPELINRIFRAVHSLKGSAGFFGFQNITSLSHVMESLLSMVRDGKLAPTSKMITKLLEGTDLLKQMVEDIDNSESVDAVDVIKELDAFLTGEAAVEMVEIPVENKDSLPDKLSKQFQIPVSELKKALAHGHFLYSVHAFTKKDMKQKGKTPLDYLKNIEKLGRLIGSYADLSTISGLDNSIVDNDMSFVYLFSSVLEPDLIAIGLEVEDSQILTMDIPEFIDKEFRVLHTAHQSPDVLPEEDKIEEEPQKKKKAKKEEPVEAEIEPVEETLQEAIPHTAEVEKTVNSSKKDTTHHQETLRVSVSLLNNLMAFAGELVLARNQLLRMASEPAKDVPGLSAVLQDIDMTTSVLQEKIMNTRMQPISLVFNKFPRMIRELGMKLDKKIVLETSGNDVDLDKSIIENLSDPMTHLVRNCADHAIEIPADRLKKGKPEQGTVWLKAYHEGGKVNIDVIDDGAGIDAKKILKKAIEKNVVSKEDGDKLSEKQMLELIFAPGFSTAEQVSDVSGRGVGMDVVKTNIEKLGGSVSIESTINVGTKINLKLPLTLAIIPSLIVKTNEMHFALPQVSLKELVRVKNDDENRKIEKVNESPVLRLRNNLLPIVYLSEVLGIEEKHEDSEITRVLVLKHDMNEFGLVVDEIVGVEEIVVKSIPLFFKNTNCYSGTTIMGDGSVSLILDISGLANKAGLNFASIREQEKALNIDEDIISGDASEHQDILLFENAEEEYFALNLDLIKRIEKLYDDDFELVGEKEYIEHENKSLRVIRLEHFLPVKARQEQQDFRYVIIPKLLENPIGIVAHKIIDSLSTKIHIDTENITSKGLIGSALLEDKLVLFPDIYQIVELAEPEKSLLKMNNKNSKYRILIVEDTSFFRTLEKQYFESAGFKVDTAIDGLDALKKITKTNYDLFVVDLLMPRMDGYEFTREVRKNAKFINTPCVAVTTLTSDESRAKAKDAGFDAYEIKIHKEKLMETVTSLLHAEKFE